MKSKILLMPFILLIVIISGCIGSDKTNPEDTILVDVSADKPYYQPGEIINIKIRTTDFSSNPINTDVKLSIVDPYGIKTDLALTGSDGKYTATFKPPSNGTYVITASSEKKGLNTNTGEATAIVGLRSALRAVFPTEKVTITNESFIYTYKIVNEQKTPIEKAIVDVSGCDMQKRGLSDKNGEVYFVAESKVYMCELKIEAEKIGYSTHNTKLYMYNLSAQK